jgi:hypothetical protein
MEWISTTKQPHLDIWVIISWEFSNGRIQQSKEAGNIATRAFRFWESNIEYFTMAFI